MNVLSSIWSVVAELNYSTLLALDLSQAEYFFEFDDSCRLSTNFASVT